MTLDAWAARWNIPPAALYDLRARFGIVTDPESPADSMPETAVQNAVRLRASELGGRLWRNNSGMAYNKNGTPVRFGLCNDSPQINKRIKSSDLIGLKPVMIRPEHIGRVFGQFWAREVKREDWRWRGTEREQAQLKFIKLAVSLGGDAAFITDAEDL